MDKVKRVVFVRIYRLMSWDLVWKFLGCLSYPSLCFLFQVDDFTSLLKLGVLFGLEEETFM